MRRLSDTDNLVFIPLVGENETEEILAIWRKDNDSPLLEHFLQISE